MIEYPNSNPCDSFRCIIDRINFVSSHSDISDTDAYWCMIDSLQSINDKAMSVIKLLESEITNLRAELGKK